MTQITLQLELGKHIAEIRSVSQSKLSIGGISILSSLILVYPLSYIRHPETATFTGEGGNSEKQTCLCGHLWQM